MRGLERHAISLFQMASAADPFSPNAFSVHLNTLYTHGLDTQASMHHLIAY